MPIKIKVSDLMGVYKVSKTQLAEGTGIRPNTIASYYDETIKRIPVEHLEALCRFFNCRIEELIEYIPDKKE